MSLEVTKNGDGSFTVKCGNEAVTVGGDSSSVKTSSGGTTSSGGSTSGVSSTSGGGSRPVRISIPTGPASAAVIGDPKPTDGGVKYITVWDTDDLIKSVTQSFDDSIKAGTACPGVVQVNWKGTGRLDIGRLYKTFDAEPKYVGCEFMLMGLLGNDGNS